MIQKLSTNKATTFAGVGTVMASLILTLIPQDVRTSCMDAVSATESPAMTGGLLAAGVLLTIVGPSLARKRA